MKEFRAELKLTNLLVETNAVVDAGATFMCATKEICFRQ